jgi:hypothetical protein
VVCQALAVMAQEMDPKPFQWHDLLEVADDAYEATVTTVPDNDGPYYVCAAGGEKSRLDEETVNLAMAVLRIHPR